VRTAAEGAQSLREALRRQGGELAALSNGGFIVAEPSPGDPAGPAQHAASGPRAAGREAEYELLLEMILEGSHLHYGPQRIVHTDDADLALLLGDQLYALGLARLAGLGDLEAVAELADVISLVAQAHAAADRRLADAVWTAGARAIGWGPGDGYLAAKDLARSGDPRAAEALQGVAPEGAAS
jgi:hypothetical protein